MAKTSWIERNKRKAATVKKFAVLRAELKAKRDYAGLAQAAARRQSIAIGQPLLDVWPAPRLHAQILLVHAWTFREAALNGLIPGVTKASW